MKKVLLFVVVLLVTLSVTLVLPACMYNKYETTQYFTQVENKDGVMVPNTMYLISEIASEVETKENVSMLSQEYHNILNGRAKDVTNLFFTMGLVIVILLVVIAVILIKTNNKLIGGAFITSGIINLIYHILMYYMAIMNIVK